jgi:PiT family inorganic phosphate transporter
VAIAGLLNLVGAFLSLTVAATIASGLVDTQLVTLTVVFAGLAGAIIWNLTTWFLGLPSSSSHALIGGVVGSMLAAAGAHAVEWQGLISKVIIPAAISPLIAGLVAATGTYLVYRISQNVPAGTRDHGFRIGQIGSASMVALAHGTNDAQKTMPGHASLVDWSTSPLAVQRTGLGCRGPSGPSPPRAISAGSETPARVSAQRPAYRAAMR